MTIETDLRRFLLAALALGDAGILAELALMGHTQEALQWVPFGVAALGLLCGIAALQPGPRTKAVLYGAAALHAVCGAAGVAIHLLESVEFEREIRPTDPLLEVLGAALTGSTPILAPGAFALLALVACGAAWKRHP